MSSPNSKNRLSELFPGNRYSSFGSPQPWHNAARSTTATPQQSQHSEQELSSSSTIKADVKSAIKFDELPVQESKKPLERPRRIARTTSLAHFDQPHRSSPSHVQWDTDVGSPDDADPIDADLTADATGEPLATDDLAAALTESDDDREYLGTVEAALSRLLDLVQALDGAIQNVVDLLDYSTLSYPTDDEEEAADSDGSATGTHRNKSKRLW